MNRYLRLVLLLFGVGSLAGMAALFFVPPRWQVSRQREIAAPPQEIYPYLTELRRWPSWSPWQESDYPGLVYHYAGPPSGVGAELSWDSQMTGDGSLQIVAAQPPHLLAFEMRFQGGRIRARDTLRLRPLPDGRTAVTWEDRGHLGRTLLGRLSLGLIEESMGRDLERGLANLARVVESPDRPTAAGEASPAPPVP